MENKFKKITMERIKKTIAIFILTVFCYNTLAVPVAQADIWQERRKSVRQMKAENQAAQSQEGTLLAQLPSVNFNALNHIAATAESLTPASPLIGISPQQGSAIPGWAKSLSLPLAYSNLKKTRFPSNWTASQPMIIHIQDVHQNEEAQNNIARSIQELINQSKADLVALEGAFEPIEVSRFRAYPDKEITEMVANYLLEKGKISGAVRTALTSPGPIPSFVGVDDTKLYDAHVNAYKVSASKASQYKSDLAKIEEKISQEKLSVFNKALLDYDAKIQAYRKGRIQLGEYVTRLAGAGRHSRESRRLDSSSGDPGLAPHSIQTFLQALEMEQSIDFAQVEAERAGLIRNLIENLTKAQISQLMNFSLAYRLGRIRHTDFYVYLKNLCQAHGINLAASFPPAPAGKLQRESSLTRYPEMSKYIQYILLSDKINAGEFLEEIRTLEDQGYSRLAKSPDERELVAKSRSLYLSGKLIDFALTPKEWADYKNTPSPLRGEGRGEGDFKSFESFFEHANLRDQAMTANVLKAIKESGAKLSVLVTGGFHSEGMENLFDKANVAVITLAPKITKVEGKTGTEYLSVFTREKTPLEKLFNGEKLFLVDKNVQLTDLTRREGAMLYGAADGMGDSTFHQVGGPAASNFHLNVRPGSNGKAHATVSGPKYALAFDVSVYRALKKIVVENMKPIAALVLTGSIGALAAFATPYVKAMTSQETALLGSLILTSFLAGSSRDWFRPAFQTAGVPWEAVNQREKSTIFGRFQMSILDRWRRLSGMGSISRQSLFNRITGPNSVWFDSFVAPEVMPQVLEAQSAVEAAHNVLSEIEVRLADAATAVQRNPDDAPAKKRLANIRAEMDPAILNLETAKARLRYLTEERGENGPPLVKKSTYEKHPGSFKFWVRLHHAPKDELNEIAEIAEAFRTAFRTGDFRLAVELTCKFLVAHYQSENISFAGESMTKIAISLAQGDFNKAASQITRFLGDSLLERGHRQSLFRRANAILKIVQKINRAHERGRNEAEADRKANKANQRWHRWHNLRNLFHPDFALTTDRPGPPISADDMGNIRKQAMEIAASAKAHVEALRQAVDEIEWQGRINREAVDRAFLGIGTVLAELGSRADPRLGNAVSDLWTNNMQGIFLAPLAQIEENLAAMERSLQILENLPDNPPMIEMEGQQRINLRKLLEDISHPSEHGGRGELYPVPLPTNLTVRGYLSDATTIEELRPLSVRTYNCIKNAKIHTVGDLVKKSERQLLKIKNFGRASLDEIRKLLEMGGRRLRNPGEVVSQPSSYLSDDTTIDNLYKSGQLSVRAHTSLKNANINKIQELVAKSEEELRFHRKPLKEIIEVLAVGGRRLRKPEESVTPSSPGGPAAGAWIDHWLYILPFAFWLEFAAGSFFGDAAGIGRFAAFAIGGSAFWAPHLLSNRKAAKNPWVYGVLTPISGLLSAMAYGTGFSQAVMQFNFHSIAVWFTALNPLVQTAVVAALLFHASINIRVVWNKFFGPSGEVTGNHSSGGISYWLNAVLVAPAKEAAGLYFEPLQRLPGLGGSVKSLEERTLRGFHLLYSPLFQSFVLMVWLSAGLAEVRMGDLGPFMVPNSVILASFMGLVFLLMMSKRPQNWKGFIQNLIIRIAQTSIAAGITFFAPISSDISRVVAAFLVTAGLTSLYNALVFWARSEVGRHPRLPLGSWFPESKVWSLGFGLVLELGFSLLGAHYAGNYLMQFTPVFLVPFLKPLLAFVIAFSVFFGPHLYTWHKYFGNWHTARNWNVIGLSIGAGLIAAIIESGIGNYAGIALTAAHMVWHIGVNLSLERYFPESPFYYARRIIEGNSISMAEAVKIHYPQLHFRTGKDGILACKIGKVYVYQPVVRRIFDGNFDHGLKPNDELHAGDILYLQTTIQRWDETQVYAPMFLDGLPKPHTHAPQFQGVTPGGIVAEEPILLVAESDSEIGETPTPYILQPGETLVVVYQGVEPQVEEFGEKLILGLYPSNAAAQYPAEYRLNPGQKMAVVVGQAGLEQPQISDGVLKVSEPILIRDMGEAPKNYRPSGSGLLDLTALPVRELRHGSRRISVETGKPVIIVKSESDRARLRVLKLGGSIVVFPSHLAEQAKQYQGEEIKRRISVGKSDAYVFVNPIENPHQKPNADGLSSDALKIRDSEIQVVKGNIATIPSDAVVPGMNTEMDVGAGVTGAIIQALLGAKRFGGNERKVREQAFPEGDYEMGQAVAASLEGIENSSGWKFVISAMIHSFKKYIHPTEETIKFAIESALRAADDNNVVSVTLPAFGTRALGIPSRLSAKWMLSAIKQFLEQGRTKNIKSVKLVLYDEETYQYFLRELQFISNTERGAKREVKPNLAAYWAKRLMGFSHEQARINWKVNFGFESGLLNGIGFSIGLGFPFLSLHWLMFLIAVTALHFAVATHVAIRDGEPLPTFEQFAKQIVVFLPYFFLSLPDLNIYSRLFVAASASLLHFGYDRRALKRPGRQNSSETAKSARRGRAMLIARGLVTAMILLYTAQGTNGGKAAVAAQLDNALHEASPRVENIIPGSNSLSAALDAAGPEVQEVMPEVWKEAAAEHHLPRLTDEQIRHLSEEIYLHGFSLEAMAEAFETPGIDQTTTIAVVVDPAAPDQMQYCKDAMQAFADAGGKGGIGTLVLLAGGALDKAKLMIEADGLEINVRIEVDPSLLPNGQIRIDALRAQARALRKNSLSHLRFSIPRGVVSDLEGLLRAFEFYQELKDALISFSDVIAGVLKGTHFLKASDALAQEEKIRNVVQQSQ